MKVRIRKYKDVLCEYGKHHIYDYIRSFLNKFGGCVFKAFEKGDNLYIDLNNGTIKINEYAEQIADVVDYNSELSDVKYKVFKTGDIVIFNDVRCKYGRVAYGITNETAICKVVYQSTPTEFNLTHLTHDLNLEVVYSSVYPYEIGNRYVVSSMRFDIADNQTISGVYKDMMSTIDKFYSSDGSVCDRICDINKILKNT